MQEIKESNIQLYTDGHTQLIYFILNMCADCKIKIYFIITSLLLLLYTISMNETSLIFLYLKHETIKLKMRWR